MVSIRFEGFGARGSAMCRVQAGVVKVVKGRLLSAVHLSLSDFLFEGGHLPAETHHLCPKDATTTTTTTTTNWSTTVDVKYRLSPPVLGVFFKVEGFP